MLDLLIEALTWDAHQYARYDKGFVPVVSIWQVSPNHWFADIDVGNSANDSKILLAEVDNQLSYDACVLALARKWLVSRIYIPTTPINDLEKVVNYVK